MVSDGNIEETKVYLFNVQTSIAVYASSEEEAYDKLPGIDWHNVNDKVAQFVDQDVLLVDVMKADEE